MRLFLILILLTQSVFGAAIWPNGQRLQTFQNGLLFGNNETLDATTDNFTFSGGGTFQGPFVLEQQTTPSNPLTGFNKLYFKSDDNLYKLDETGTETNVSSVFSGGQQQSGANFGTLRFPNQQVVSTGTGEAYVSNGNKNLLLNPEFEHSTYSVGWTTGGTATYSAETSAPLSGLKSFKAVASSQTIQLYQDTTLYAATSSGSQLYAKIVATNTASGVTLCTRKNGVKQTGTNDCVTLATDGVKKSYEIGFLVDGTSNGLEISAASTSGTLVIDEAEITSDSKNMIDVAQIGPWISYTPTFQGLGTPTGVSAFYRVNGSNIDLDIKLSPGTTNGDETRVSLPTGFTSATTARIPTIMQAGVWFIGDSGANKGGAVLIEPSVTYITFSSRDVFGSSSTNPLSKGVGTVTLLGNSVIRASVPVQGLSNKITTYSQACTTDVQCENVFSAKFTGGGACTIVTQNPSFIDSCTRTGAGRYTITFTSGVFTVEPSVVVENNGGDRINTSIDSLSTTTLLLTTHSDDGGTAFTDDNFQIIVTKQGADFKAKNVITGSFQGIEKCANPYECTQVFSAVIGSTGTVTTENLDFIDGNCTNAFPNVCTFKSGVFTVTPSCHVVSVAGSQTVSANISAQSTSSVSIRNSTNASSEVTAFNLICQKQGADFVPKTAVAGTYIDTNLSPGAGRVGLCSAKVSSTGVVTDQIGGCITTCTNANPRVCTFTSNYWQSGSVPNCNATSQLMGAAWASAVASTTTLSIYTANDVGASSPQATNFQCQGLLR